MRTSRQWQEYYAWNAGSLLAIPREAGEELTRQERKAITSSVQGFQAGESSEGRHLFHDAKHSSERVGDPDYLATIKLFIAEEQRHAGDLARFLHCNHR